MVTMAAAGTSVIVASPAHADYNRCARYLLSKKGQPVPLQLLPSGRMMSPTAAAAAASAKPGGECA